jgi:CrcB protein
VKPYFLGVKLLFYIGAGSFLGGIARFGLSKFVQELSGDRFPVGTLSVNILGSFFIGLMFALAEQRTVHTELRLFLTTGLLGGFTTFSTFSYEVLGLLRSGEWLTATVYLLASTVAGVLAAFGGYQLLKIW